jgi:hypothetical protein
MISVDDLIGGGAIALPPKEVYIDALEDTIIIQPVPLERYREYQDASPDKQAECLLRCIAESISQQGGMSIDESRELVDTVRAKVHPEAWNQITTAVMITMFGEEQVRRETQRPRRLRVPALPRARVYSVRARATTQRRRTRRLATVLRTRAIWIPA